MRSCSRLNDKLMHQLVVNLSLSRDQVVTRGKHLLDADIPAIGNLLPIYMFLEQNSTP